MDQPIPSSEAAGLPLIGPHLRLHSETELPPSFVPMRLVLKQTGTLIEITRPDMLLGRHTDADIRLPLPDVSRRHCRLVFIEGGWQVMDLNSLNGIKVNGEQVLQAPLEQDDELRIGGFQFVVHLSGDATLGSANHVQSILKTLSEPRRQAS